MNFSLLPNELIIDNFAGGGGTSTGLEQAFKRPVDVAINHDPKALAMHRINHPDTKHYCESVWDIDPIEATGNQPVGLVWLSPDCKHFSKAKGSKPVEKKIRGLAWVALRWAAKTRPRVIMLENVEEFKTWGDLDESGKPCPKKKGRTFNSFVNALNRQGYEVEWRELRACDYGSPTIRKRFFLIARRDGLPIVWPKRTHGDPESIQVQKGVLKPWRTAGECINWSIDCPSIFNRKRPLKPRTLTRIWKGIERFVVNAPIHTVTTKNTCSLEISHLSKMKKNCIGQKLSEPLHAMTTVNHFAEVRAFLTAYYGNEKDGNSLAEPLRTIPTKDRFGLITIQQQQYQITDIGFRMLQPVELFKAQGFPESYVFEKGIDEHGNEIRLTKTEQTRMVGNSVCPQLSRALVEANFKHENKYQGAA
ncbi:MULTISPECIES: DNA cytosine methyltransferase [unclassified Acinetobacter]|uniref:DNA cytosine methyltransferase n=1 Tax=unclassified Acinetobacter TaxID=196816 RepID=UPI0025C0BB71|nr:MULTISPECIES: DNA (cytosine-5-)-methyltransferase [unclassified Acinetobacter]